MLPLEGSLDLGTLPGLEHNRLAPSSVRASRVPSIIPDSVDLRPLSKPFVGPRFEPLISSTMVPSVRGGSFERDFMAFETSFPRGGILEPSSFEVPPSRVVVLNAPSFCASHDDPQRKLRGFVRSWEKWARFLGRGVRAQFDTTARSVAPDSSIFTAQLLDCAVDAARLAVSLGTVASRLESCRYASLCVFAFVFFLRPSSPSSVMAQFADPAPWKPSNATKHCLDSLVEVGVLPPNVDGEPPVWISPGAATEPDPPRGYVVSFARFHERGFGVPVERFMRALCFHYKVELHNFSPNAISQAAVFVAVCEGYLGIEAHWDLWCHLFVGELFLEYVSKGVRRPARAGGLVLQVRKGRKDLYIPSSMVSNNQDWDKGWFYLRNDGGHLPPYTGLLLTEKQADWHFGVSPPSRKKKLDPLVEALQRLSRLGLTAGGVIANFHRRWVLPLMRRRLALHQMTPDADLTGTVMAAEPLPVATAVQRARRAVDKLPDDPWTVPMRPEDGYVSLGVSRGHYSKPPVPEDKAVNRALAEKAKEAKARREARSQRKERKRKKLEAENRERARRGLSPLPAPESSTDRAHLRSSFPSVGPPPAAASGGDGEEVIDLGTPPSTAVPSVERPSGAATAVPEGTQGQDEAPPSTAGPSSEGPSGAAPAALEEPQGGGEAPERPGAVEEAPARGAEAEVPQVEPVDSTRGEEASRVTPRGKPSSPRETRPRGRLLKGNPSRLREARSRGQLPFRPRGQNGNSPSTPSLAPTKALKIGPSSSPHPSSQLLGPTNEVVEDFVTFFDTQAELQARQQPREEAPPVLEGPRPPQLLEGAVEPHVEAARPEEANPAPGEALRVEEPSAAPVEADAVVVPPHEGGERRTHGGGFPHLTELAEALGVGAPVAQGHESGGAAPSTLITAQPGPVAAWSYEAHARGSAEMWQPRSALPQRFVDEAVAEETLWEVQSSHGLDVRRALQDILRLHDDAGKVHRELRKQALAKNDQIAELSLELRRLSGALEARDRQLDDLRGARDQALAQGREKGEVIARLEGSASALREQLANRNDWLENERAARRAAELAVEEERRLAVEARDRLEQEQTARATAERQAREVEQRAQEAERALEAAQDRSRQALQAETESKEAVLRELDELVQAASAACNEIAGPGLQSGSTLVSRVRALGGHFTSRVKEALLLGVRKALGVVTTHYQADLLKLAAGYVIADNLNDEEAVEAMDEADAAADGTARVLAGYFEGALFPGEDGGGWDNLGGGGDP
nr:unnamed protein product [Digitaria exilis]